LRLEETTERERQVVVGLYRPISMRSRRPAFQSSVRDRDGGGDCDGDSDRARISAGARAGIRQPIRDPNPPPDLPFPDTIETRQ